MSTEERRPKTVIWFLPLNLFYLQHMINLVNILFLGKRLTFENCDFNNL
jgi:hypothetical protein